MNQGVLSSLSPILAAPWLQRRNMGALWGAAVIVALVTIGPVAVFVWSLLTQFGALDLPAGSQPAVELSASLRHTAANTGLMSIAVLALAWWGVIVSNLLDQNHPTLARMVPAHPARLRAALLLTWAGLVALVTLLVGVRFDVALPCAAVTAVGLALLAASVRWPLLWLTGAVAPVAVHYALESHGLDAAFDALRRQWLAQPATIFLTLAAASAVLLVALIQSGGVRHIASDEARRNRIRRFQARARGGVPGASGTRGCLDAFFNRPYYAVLDRTLSRPVSALFPRVMLALGPGSHWTSGPTALVGSALAVAAGTAVLEAVGIVVPAVSDLAPDALVGISVGLLPGLLAPSMQIQARLHQTRREQALLTLLPGVPHGAALSRRLAWQLTGQFLASWIGGLLLAALTMAAARLLQPGVVRPALLDLRNIMAVATLPLVVFQWRPWARIAAPTALNAMWPLLTGAAIGALVGVGRLTGLFSLTAVAVASVTAAVAWCAMRWWRMGSEPSALPVGRLA